MPQKLAPDHDPLAPGPTISVNSDLTQRVVIHAAEVPWSPSPWIPGIERKFLDRQGNGQFVPSTSVVSFGTGVKDPYHTHPHGEEFIVLSGVFTDHTGDYLPGFYVRHPIGWCHSPYVDMRNDAAVVWVKVSCQVALEGESILVIDTCDMTLPDWTEGVCTKGRVQKLPLYGRTETGERVWIEVWAPATECSEVQPEGGDELFVISGSLTENGVTHPAWTWIRSPAERAGTRWQRASSEGCKLIRKSGHLAMVAELYEQAKDGAKFSSDVLQYKEHERIHGSPHGVDTKRREREGA